METAVNISQACGHFKPEMKLHFLIAHRDSIGCHQTLEGLYKALQGRSGVSVGS